MDKPKIEKEYTLEGLYEEYLKAQGVDSTEDVPEEDKKAFIAGMAQTVRLMQEAPKKTPSIQYFMGVMYELEKEINAGVRKYGMDDLLIAQQNKKE